MFCAHSVLQRISLVHLITTHPTGHSQAPLPDPCQAGTWSLSALPFPKPKEGHSTAHKHNSRCRTVNTQGTNSNKGCMEVEQMLQPRHLMGILHGSAEVPNQKWAPITKICLLEHLPSSSHLTHSFTSVFLDHVPNKLNALESLSLFGGRKRMLCLKCIQDKCMSVHRETWGSYIERWWCLFLWANLQRFSLQTFLYYCDYYHFSSDVIFINFF